ncbi:uncharacterized protein LOC129195186 [Grus americana]|uniref:uncharacterized protein LOC129195186 n=1 Tax=Grus americana TaxID=9117 RepID=UPI0024082018|nr:uncharacterized protein LOC129195186 [Grus americana]
MFPNARIPGSDLNRSRKRGNSWTRRRNGGRLFPGFTLDGKPLLPRPTPAPGRGSGALSAGTRPPLPLGKHTSAAAADHPRGPAPTPLPATPPPPAAGHRGGENLGRGWQLAPRPAALAGPVAACGRAKSCGSALSASPHLPGGASHAPNNGATPGGSPPARGLSTLLPFRRPAPRAPRPSEGPDRPPRPPPYLRKRPAAAPAAGSLSYPPPSGGVLPAPSHGALGVVVPPCRPTPRFPERAVRSGLQVPAAAAPRPTCALLPAGKSPPSARSPTVSASADLLRAVPPGKGSPPAADGPRDGRVPALRLPACPAQPRPF